MNVGVDRYKRPPKRSLAKEQALQREREHYLQMQGAVLGYLLVRLLMADGERVISG